VSLDAAPVTLTTDRRRVERVVSNLVENALAHGSLEAVVKVGEDAEGAFVDVSDLGPGIAAEDLPHVFERFYKADPARAGGGSGLGLAIALENARLLGGEISVWSRPGAGARFTLRLPVTRPLPIGEAPVAAGHENRG
jgi:two-component system sensor histidine kinase MtrB